MSIIDQSFKNKLNSANHNVVPDMMRSMKFGNTMRAMPCQLRKKDPAASAYNLATVEAVGLADDAKAAFIMRAVARAGAVTGELAAVAYGVTPATGQIAVAPNGEIVTLAADAITDLDVLYVPEKYDAVFDITLPCVTHVLTIPSSFTAKGVALLMYAEALVGGSTGKKIVLIPGAGAPAAGQARLNIAKSTVTFAVADAVTSAKITFAIASDVDLDALLTAASSIG
jgi:hypothetical protein